MRKYITRKKKCTDYKKFFILGKKYNCKKIFITGKNIKLRKKKFTYNKILSLERNT